MMAVDLNSTELLLPSLFSNEHSINKNHSSCVFSSSDSVYQPKSLVLSETENEDNGVCITKLTQQMAHGYDEHKHKKLHSPVYSETELTRRWFQDDDQHEKSWGSVTDPLKSTVRSPFGSTRESPFGDQPSQMSPIIEKFTKIKISPEEKLNQYTGFQSKQVLHDNQIKAIQFYKLKREQEMKQLEKKEETKYDERSKQGGCGGVGFENRQKPGDKAGSCSWSGLKQQHINHNKFNNYKQNGSDHKRAIFLGGSGSKPANGTGVFLPRGTGLSLESRKKKGCSMVLIPARVVQALELHFVKMGVPSRFNNDLLMVNSKSSISQQKRQFKDEPKHQEIELPQEWTY